MREQFLDSNLETDNHRSKSAFTSRFFAGLDRLPLWLWVILSLTGYIVLAIWFPLIPHFDRIPLADVRSLAPTLGEGFLYAVLICLLFAFFAQSYRRVRIGIDKLDIARLLGISVLFSLPLLLVYPINANDIYRYVMRGRIQSIYGANPYSFPPDSFPEDPFLPFGGEWSGETSPYGPVWEIAASSITHISNDSLLLGLLSFKLIGWLAFTAVAFVLWKLFSLVTESNDNESGVAAPTRSANTLLWAWNPALLLIFVANGHNDAVMIFCLILGVYFIRRNNLEFGLLLMLLGPLIKPIGLLAFPFFFVTIWRRLRSKAKRLRLLLVTAAGGFLLVVISFMPFGTPLELGQRLIREANAGGGFSPGVTLVLIGQRFGYALSLTVVAKVTLLLFGLLAIWLLCRTWQGRSPVRGTADIYFGFLLQALNFRIWYASWPFPWLLIDARTNMRGPVKDIRLRYGLWFLLTSQLSVVIYGHIRVFLLGGSQLWAHILGTLFVFALPLLLSFSVKNGPSVSPGLEQGREDNAR